MDRLFQDLRLAFRSLTRQPTFSGVVILTLALAVGATTAIFSVVHGILLQPLPYEGSHRLVALGQTARSAPDEPVGGSTSPVNFRDWQRLSRTIPEMALYAGGRAVISDQGAADVVPIGTVTPEFFEVFRARPLRGRGFNDDENRVNGPLAVVVSYGFWQERLGGRDDVLSQHVEISGVSWPIVGVAPRGFDFPGGARLWRPLRNDDEQCGRDCVYVNGIGRLADGVSVEAAQQEMTAISATLEREFPGANTDVTVAVQTLQERTVGNVRLALLAVFGAVVMVLLIACANVANLVLVRGAARQQELTMRLALGAGRRGVLSYLLAENLVLAAAGGIGGMVLATWGIAALKAAAPQNLPRLQEVGLGAQTFLFALGLVMMTLALFGIGPSLQLSRASLRAVGQRGTIGTSRSRWTRSALLVAEVGLSLMLLLGAGLLLRSVAALQEAELGFDERGITVFMVSLPPARYPSDQVMTTHAQLDEQFSALPGVTSVGRISGLPLGVSENVLTFTRADRPPPPPGQAPGALYRVVDPEYFDTLGIPVIGGRGFTAADREGSERVMVISRRMAEQFWPGENPVGRPVSVGGADPATVVGVVANVRSQAVASEAGPEMYVPHAQTTVRSIMYVLKSSADSAQVLSAARDVVRRLDARLPLLFPGSMEALVDEQLARPRFYFVLISLFAGLAAVLAAVGIYGVVAYVVTQRTREIGVRMALGARQGQVVALMLWQGLRPAALGIVVGLLAALAVGRVIQGLLYETAPHDPLTFVGVTVLFLVVVLLASVIPAHKASEVPPAGALRAE